MEIFVNFNLNTTDLMKRMYCVKQNIMKKNKHNNNNNKFCQALYGGLCA